MPAKSKTQQRLMGMVHAYKEGKLDTKGMDPALVSKVKSIAGSMKGSDAKKFAETKHKGLPEEVKEMTKLTFKEYLLLEATLGQKHSQRGQITRRRGQQSKEAQMKKAGQKTDLKTTLSTIYRRIKERKGEVSYEDFSMAVQDHGNLSVQGWKALEKSPSFQEFVQYAKFAGQDAPVRGTGTGQKDPWAHVKVARDERRQARQSGGARDYFG